MYSYERRNLVGGGGVEKRGPEAWTKDRRVTDDVVGVVNAATAAGGFPEKWGILNLAAAATMEARRRI